MAGIFYFLFVFVVVALMVTYSCWLLFHRLKSGENKRKGFWEWVKNILQTIWGI
jgi:hypothetical protein